MAIVELRLNLLMPYNVKKKKHTHAHIKFGTQFWDGFVTRSVREMIDFLMSILSTQDWTTRAVESSRTPTPFCIHADKTSNFVDLFLSPTKMSVQLFIGRSLSAAAR